MARVVVIGATGHVGGVPGPEVGAGRVRRGGGQPGRGVAVPGRSGLARCRAAELDRSALEADAGFGAEIAALGGDIVIDLICFTLASARQLVEAVADDLDLLVHIGTVWTHGHSVAVPTPEDAREEAVRGLRDRQGRGRGVPAAAGPSRRPAGHDRPPGPHRRPGLGAAEPGGPLQPGDVRDHRSRRQLLTLPNLGLETVHHVHADDVAGVVMATIAHRHSSIGESFHAVSEQALSLHGYAEEMYRWFGREPRLDFLPYAEWAVDRDPDDASATWDHIAHSPRCSMAKARRLLDFRPRYSSLEAVQESVTWLIANGRLAV